MIGLDTNVFLRLLMQDDEAQARQVNALLPTLTDVRVNDLVIAESAWALSRMPGARRKSVEARLAALLLGEGITPLDPETLRRAHRESERHGFGLADGLIGARNRAAGCETTYTFDRRAARSDLFTVVP